MLHMYVFGTFVKFEAGFFIFFLFLYFDGFFIEKSPEHLINLLRGSRIKKGSSLRN